MQKYADYYGQPQRVLKTWQAALYIRLSKEDLEKNKTESASIANQREILKEYLRNCIRISPTSIPMLTTVIPARTLTVPVGLG